MKTKLLPILLILVFAMSISCVVAGDNSAIPEDLSAADDGEIVAAAADDEVLSAAESSDETLGATQDDTTAADENADPTEGIDTTFCSVKIDVLDKNYKVGDKVRVKITVTNIGIIPAEDVVVGLSFTDPQGNPDGSFKLLDNGKYAISQVEQGYEIQFGHLEPNESQTIILTFLATEPGQKIIHASVTGDNVENSEQAFEMYDNATITVVADESAAGNSEQSSSKMLATGNPLAILALALLTLVVPYYRRR